MVTLKIILQLVNVAVGIGLILSMVLHVTESEAGGGGGGLGFGSVGGRRNSSGGMGTFFERFLGVLIEHHLDLIKNADWIIDLGPGAGDKGGYVIAEGRPEDLTSLDHSSTGQYLKRYVPTAKPKKKRSRKRRQPVNAAG